MTCRSSSHSWPALSVPVGNARHPPDACQKRVGATLHGAGLLSEGSFVSQPPSRRSSLGNSGASTPRGLPRTSSLPAAVGAQQLVTAGGPVRLAPAVPKLVLPAAAGPAADGCRENQADNRPVQTVPSMVACTPRSMFPKTLARREAAATAEPPEAEGGEPSRVGAAGRERLAPRRSIGGAALRMSVATFRVSLGCRVSACLTWRSQELGLHTVLFS